VSRLVVIGASQGGVQALHALVSGLPPDLPAPVLVVLHIGTTQSILPSILNDIDSHVAAFGRNGCPMVDGHIYVAPPDRHMLVMDGRLELSRAPRENWARPAIDPLFRSAAESYGPDAIGVILSGRLNDGTAGLYEIKRRGGIAIVQTPSSAEAPDMPTSALENVPVDYCLPIPDMPRLLMRLLSERTEQRFIGNRGGPAMDEEPKIVEPSAQTCPECGGAMREVNVGTLTRFRCHTGHVMTAEVLASAQIELLESDISRLLRLLNERVGLCRDIADKHALNGNTQAAEAWERAAAEAARREVKARELVNASWEHPEGAAKKAVE
jgi:two-component system, chemotaxis family, protein-glutamate methylesterase/glutaminase